MKLMDPAELRHPVLCSAPALPCIMGSAQDVGDVSAVCQACQIDENGNVHE